jgi:hypothetical protein
MSMDPPGRARLSNKRQFSVQNSPSMYRSCCSLLCVQDEEELLSGRLVMLRMQAFKTSVGPLSWFPQSQASRASAEVAVVVL